MKKIKEKRSDKVQREQFPGYPPYPDSEDITLKNKRIPVDNEGVPVINNEEGLLDDTQVQQTDDSDLTDDDLQALGPADLSMDMGEDEDLLKQRAEPVDFAGSDLDIPGSELDNDSEKLGSEDEENNSYSIGGDNGDRLEERKD